MKLWRYGIILALLLTCLLGSCTYNNHSPLYKIALIHSYQEGYNNAEKINSLLQKELTQKGIQCEIRKYYLNCEKYNSVDEEQRCIHFAEDLKQWGANLIAVLDDQATYSLMACNSPVVKEMPVVFSGVNYPNMDLLAQYPNVTGYIDKPNYMNTCRMIEKIMGKVRLHIIKGNTFLDKTIWKDFQKQCKGQNINIRNWTGEKALHMPVNFLGDEDMTSTPVHEKLMEYTHLDTTMVVKLESDSIRARSLLWLASGAFNYSLFLFTKRDFTTLRIASLFDNPGFETINEGFGANDYMMGGYFATIETQLKDMAEGIKERLENKMPDRQLRQCAKEYVVNWKTLKKYKIPADKIPSEYTIMYMPFTERYYVSLLIVKTVTGIFLLIFIAYLIYMYSREKKRKQNAQRSLKYEHEVLTLAIEGGNSYAWRLEGNTVYFDAQFRELIHHGNTQMTIQEIFPYIHPDEQVTFEHNLRQILSRPKRTSQYRCKFTGEYQWWEFRYNIIHNNEEHYIITGILQNIQETKDKEEELIQARQLAEQAELKQSFLANMSHEIRTPLNAIAGFSNLLTTEKDLSDEEKQEFVAIINNNTSLLLKLVNDVLELSRIESGNMSFSYNDENLRTLLESIYQTHQLLVPSTLEFIKDFPEEEVTVRIDSMRMTQVITNFLNNASKFTQSGYIKLGYKYMAKDNEVHIFVEDTGTGIPKNEQKMIFARFYKHNEFAQGVGLGLSICKIIIEKMGGRIEVVSEIKKGSRFTVVLPCI